MSFGLPSVKVKPEQTVQAPPAEGPYGIPSPLTAGLSAMRTKLGTSHQLEFSERNFNLNEERLNLQMLRNTQGLHAPLKITMEMKAASKVGHLPFLPSSNLQTEVLTGRYIDIGFDDFLGTPDLREVVGQPHAIVERQLGIL